MVLSNQKDVSQRIYCPIREKWVARLPEEIVRQKLVKLMVEKYGFPIGSLALEKKLSQLPHLTLFDGKIPLRRADLICFAKGIHPEFSLYPLLLVECKAVKLTPKVITQIVGYNQFLGAHFVAIVNQEEIKVGWMDHSLKKYRFIDYLPTYSELMKVVGTSI